MTAPAPPTGFGMRRRLLLAQTLVLLAGGVTTWVVALVVGPPLFREHLHQAGLAHDANDQFHAEQAYQHATALSIAVAITVAALTAFVVTAYLSRRLQRSITEVSAAASAIAEGHYDVRVAPPQLGDEFDHLATAFNRMAQRLQSVETTRRQLFGDLAHEIRTPVSVLEAYLEAVEDGVKTLDPPTIATLREQTGRLVRFAADAAALSQAEEAHSAIAPDWVDTGELLRAVGATVADRYAAKKVTLTITGGIALAYMFWPHKLIGVFSTDPDVLSQGTMFLRLFAVAMVFLAANVTLVRAFQGSGDTLWPSCVAGARLAAFVLIGWLFGHFLHLKAMGVWLAMVVSAAVQLVLMWWLYSLGTWKHKRLRSLEPEPEEDIMET